MLAGVIREGAVRAGQFSVALLSAASLVLCAGCAGMQPKPEETVSQKGESVTRRFSADKDLWEAAKGAVRVMGFTYHTERAAGKIETEPMRWLLPGADAKKIKDYRARVSVRVEELSVSVEALWTKKVEALWGKKIEPTPKRDASSADAEQKLLNAWFEEFARQLAAGPMETGQIPDVENYMSATVRPPVKPEQPQDGKPALAEKTVESRAEAVKRVNYAGKEDVILLDTPKITPSSAAPGGRVVQELRYTLLSPQPDRIIAIQETIVISDGQGLLVPLVKNKKLKKEQRTHLSVLRFVLPQDIPPGEYRLQTTISAGELKASASGTFQVVR